MRVKTCIVCGKEFILSAENIYKVRIRGRVKHMCSWTCVRSYEKEKEEIKEALRDEIRRYCSNKGKRG